MTGSLYCKIALDYSYFIPHKPSPHTQTAHLSVGVLVTQGSGYNQGDK